MSSYRKSFDLFYLLALSLLLILLLSRTFRHVTHIIIILSQKKSVAEGYDTVKALCALADRYHVDLPIGRAVYAVLYDGAQPKEQMNQLFTRSLKREFDI